jgi:hypothetical protein
MNVGDLDRDEPSAGADRVRRDDRLPHVGRVRRVEVGAGQDGNGATGRRRRPPHGVANVVGRDRRGGRRPHHPDAVLGEQGVDPVRPHPVLRDVAEVNVPGRRLTRADEGRPVPQPGVLAHLPEGADPALGDGRSEALVGAQQSQRGPRGVSERRQGLLEVVIRLVGDDHGRPVVVLLVLAHILRKRIEFRPGQVKTGVCLVLLRLVDSHGHR